MTVTDQNMLTKAELIYGLANAVNPTEIVDPEEPTLTEKMAYKRVLTKEYELIMAKKSNLSSNTRKRIVYLYNSLIK